MAGILFIGDSRCVGLSSGSASTKNEKGECVARAPAMNVESKKGGKSTAKGCNGTDSKGDNWFCMQNKTLEWVKENQVSIDSLAKNSDVVIFTMGGNDVGRYNDYIDYFHKLKDHPFYKGKQIFFVGIPPRRKDKITANNAAKRFNEKLKNGLPEGVTFIDLDPCFKKHKLENHFAGDGIHFDQTANKIMYEYVNEQIENSTKIALKEQRKEMDDADIVIETDGYCIEKSKPNSEQPVEEDEKGTFVSPFIIIM